MSPIYLSILSYRSGSCKFISGTTNINWKFGQEKMWKALGEIPCSHLFQFSADDCIPDRRPHPPSLKPGVQLPDPGPVVRTPACSPPPPSSAFKNACDYTGPTQVTQVTLFYGQLINKISWTFATYPKTFQFATSRFRGCRELDVDILWNTLFYLPQNAKTICLICNLIVKFVSRKSKRKPHTENRGGGLNPIPGSSSKVNQRSHLSDALLPTGVYYWLAFLFSFLIFVLKGKKIPICCLIILEKWYRYNIKVQSFKFKCFIIHIYW